VAAKHTILFKKLTASFLLALLFAATVTKVLHLHSYSTVAIKKIQLDKNSFSNHEEPVSETKCLICDYQLTKDADVSHSLPYIIYTALYNNATAQFYAFTSKIIYSVFDTRGPPSC
jgi:hypothetical protein